MTTIDSLGKPLVPHTEGFFSYQTLQHEPNAAPFCVVRSTMHPAGGLQWKSVEDVFSAKQPQITTVKNVWKKSVGQVFMNPVGDKSGVKKVAYIAFLILAQIFTLGTALAYRVCKERRDYNTISVSGEKLKTYLAFVGKCLDSENWNAAIGATEEGGKGDIIFSSHMMHAKQEIRAFYERELCPELVRLYDNIKQAQTNAGENYSKDICQRIVAEAIIKRYKLTKFEQITLMTLLMRFDAFNTPPTTAASTTTSDSAS